MSAPSFFFYYQKEGKESKWNLELAAQRQHVIDTVRPAFATALDLSGVPDDNDWSKVRYRGSYYVDFDDEDDLENAADQLKVFLVKLDEELDFDVTQASIFATGSKGFHVEIPSECFMAKVPPTGTAWLPYIYRAMSESLMVDTLDLNVYTGKKGRQWRTPNVERENGCFKVPLTLDEAYGMSSELYHEIIKAPRPLVNPTPATLCTKFVMLYDRSRDKVTTQMRGKKKRMDRASELLDPWKKTKKVPPSIEKIMNGEVRDGVGFQTIAMQLGIFATSMGMALPEFLDRCKGLCENHVSDSRRYNTLEKRRAELTRMYEYMESDTLYDFDVAPLGRILKSGESMTDLGVMDTHDKDDAPARAKAVVDTGDEPGPAETDDYANPGVRKGFFMNAEGMWRKLGDLTESICRATLRNVEAFYDVEKHEFKGYEFDIVVGGRTRARVLLAADAFTSAANLKKFFANHQLTFQGGDIEAMALLDIMSEKAAKGGRVYTYPREGFFVINNPEIRKPTPVKCYLTKDTFLSSLKKEDEDYFELRYRPNLATSAYDIDIHLAPDLDESHREGLHDLFRFNKPEVLADLIGWFVAAHYRSAYIKLFGQFPMLQVYGEAGSAKTQSVYLLAHLHWYSRDRISVKSATACTAFALHAHASSSTSAPFIIDEYKPRELRAMKGKYEALKDVLKASYIGGDIGERGTVNKGAENHLGLIKSKSTSPIVFMGESIEMETAIIERSVIVNTSKTFFTEERFKAYMRLFSNPEPLSALGRYIVQMGFALNLDAMGMAVSEIRSAIEDTLPAINDANQLRAAPRMVFNRTVVVHALQTLKAILATKFDDEFDADLDLLINTRRSSASHEESKAITVHGMSELSKVLNRVALLSRERDMPYELKRESDYIIGDGYVELKVERAYDCYRRYCSSISDRPLFDNMDSFLHALDTYSAVTDRVCADSELKFESTDKVMRFSLQALKREGVQTFRTG